MTMHSIAVGERYHPSRTEWPECVQYNYRGGQHELVLFFRRPSHEEIRGVRRAALTLGLHVDQPVIFLLYRFAEAVPWSDAPFSIHLVPEAERAAPGMDPPHSRSLLQVILVDAATGIVRAIRVATMSPEFTALLHNAIREQHAIPFDAGAYQAAIDRAYAAGDTKELVRRALIIETAGRV